MCQNKAVLERALDPGHDKVFVHNSKGVINMIEYKGYKAHWYALYSNLPPERRIQNFLTEDYEIQALAEYIVLRDT